MRTRIRPANLLDILPLGRPPRAEVRLDLAGELLFPHHPGRSLLPWTRTPVHTLLAWDEGGLRAGVQARARPDGSAWDVVYLAAWRGDPAAAGDAWAELLLALGVVAGSQGMTRLLAALPGEEYLDLFRRVGFTPFAEETILVWDGRAAPASWPAASRPGPAVRPAQPGDLAAVQRLYAALTPPLVQQAEGSRGSGREPGEEAWIWPTGDGVCACLRRQRSPQGSRLRLLLDPACRQHAPALLAHGLDGVAPPVYLVLRSYQGELVEVARRLGFRPLAEQVLLVKQLAVLEKLRQPLPARSAERPLGTAPTTPSVGPAYAETNKSTGN